MKKYLKFKFFPPRSLPIFSPILSPLGYTGSLPLCLHTYFLFSFRFPCISLFHSFSSLSTWFPKKFQLQVIPDSIEYFVEDVTILYLKMRESTEVTKNVKANLCKNEQYPSIRYIEKYTGATGVRLLIFWYMCLKSRDPRWRGTRRSSPSSPTWSSETTRVSGRRSSSINITYVARTWAGILEQKVRSWYSGI